MARVIGIDFGAKRTGLALTDPARIIASAWETVPSADVIEHLRKFMLKEKEAVDGFVVGLPVGLNGKATDATPLVHAFIAELKKAFPEQWVETADERFTSLLAKDTLLASGKGRAQRRDKSQLDRISAAIILQGWLQQRSRTT